MDSIFNMTSNVQINRVLIKKNSSSCCDNKRDVIPENSKV
jgi:hypothetical protein